MKQCKSRKVEYAEWCWALSVPDFCATTLHHETELIRLVDGDGDIYINGEKFKLKKGDLYVVRPFTLHAMRKTGQNELIVDYVKFDLRRLAENCEPNAKIGDYLHFFNKKSAHCVIYGDSIRYNAEKIIETLFAEFSTRAQTQHAVYCMLRLLHEHRVDLPSNNITDERQHFAVQTAVEYLSLHFAEQIKIADVAALMGYDEFYAMKLFKRFCGWSIVDFLNGVRTTAAKRLLEETKLNSKQIAAEVGYRSASYFNRQFKKTFGVTPSEFRAKI